MVCKQSDMQLLWRTVSNYKGSIYTRMDMSKLSHRIRQRWKCGNKHTERRQKNLGERSLITTYIRTVGTAGIAWECLVRQHYRPGTLRLKSWEVQEPVAESLDEAEAFLEDCMAVVVKSLKEVREYFEENGTDISDMSDEDLEEASEVFALPNGRYLVVEG